MRRYWKREKKKSHFSKDQSFKNEKSCKIITKIFQLQFCIRLSSIIFCSVFPVLNLIIFGFWDKFLIFWTNSLHNIAMIESTRFHCLLKFKRTVSENQNCRNSKTLTLSLWFFSKYSGDSGKQNEIIMKMIGTTMYAFAWSVMLK